MLRNWKNQLYIFFIHTHTSKIKFTFYSCSQYWLLTESKETCRDQSYHWVDCLFSLHVIKVEFRLSSHFHSERCSHLPATILAIKIFHIKSWLTKRGLWSSLLQPFLDIMTNETSCFLLVTALFGTKFIWNCSSTPEENSTVFCWINPRFCQKNYWTSTYYRIHHCPALCMCVHYTHIYISKLFHEYGSIHLDSSFSILTTFYLLYATIPSSFLPKSSVAYRENISRISIGRYYALSFYKRKQVIHLSLFSQKY